MELWHTAVDGSQLNNNGIDVWDVNDVTQWNMLTVLPLPFGWVGHCGDAALERHGFYVI